MTTFPKVYTDVIAVVLPEEGPFSNQAGDSGGVTKWGVAYNKHNDQRAVDYIPPEKWLVWTKADSIEFLYTYYFAAHRCQDMPLRWALAVFDGEVNQGSVIKLAQRALGLTRIDGVVGQQTIDAMAKSNDWQFAEFIALRLLAYIPLSLFPSDGKGWFTRCVNVAFAAGGLDP